MPASKEEWCAAFSSPVLWGKHLLPHEHWAAIVPGSAPPAGPVILVLYLETVNIEGTRKDIKKTVPETLPLERVYSSNGDKTRVTFMWKLISCSWWTEGKQEDSGQLNMDQHVNTKRFNAPMYVQFCSHENYDEERAREGSTYSYIEIESKLT